MLQPRLLLNVQFSQKRFAENELRLSRVIALVVDPPVPLGGLMSEKYFLSGLRCASRVQCHHVGPVREIY